MDPTKQSLLEDGIDKTERKSKSYIVPSDG